PWRQQEVERRGVGAACRDAMVARHETHVDVSPLRSLAQFITGKAAVDAHGWFEPHLDRSWLGSGLDHGDARPRAGLVHGHEGRGTAVEGRFEGELAIRGGRGRTVRPELGLIDLHQFAVDRIRITANPKGGDISPDDGQTRLIDDAALHTGLAVERFSLLLLTLGRLGDEWQRCGDSECQPASRVHRGGLLVTEALGLDRWWSGF